MTKGNCRKNPSRQARIEVGDYSLIVNAPISHLIYQVGWMVLIGVHLAKDTKLELKYIYPSVQSFHWRFHNNYDFLSDANKYNYRKNQYLIVLLS